MRDKNWQTAVILGAQWGDEGKGKVTDYYGRRVDYVVRFQGGNNAGHTIVYSGKVIKLHLLPSGVLHPHCTIVIGNGVVIDPRVMFSELDELKKIGRRPKLVISDRAHIIFPFHVKLDSAGESMQAKKKLAALSTNCGIWPTYSDKMARVGVRVVDLLHPDLFKKKFDLLFQVQKKKLEMIYGYQGKKMNKQKIFKAYLRHGRRLRPFVQDVSLLLDQAYQKKQKILFEGAQGTMLDVDHGLYPYTTSSNTTAGGVATGAGFAPQRIDKVIGVVKTYISRVGGGYLPTELIDKTGDLIREKGAEYGTTTGRPRRIGWLDLVQLRLAVRLNGISSLAVTKIDILDDLPKIKVCTGYKVGRKILKEMPADLTVYEKCQPVYKILSGWPSGYKKPKLYRQLPLNLRRYLDFIAQELSVPIEMVSVGPERNDTIINES